MRQGLGMGLPGWGAGPLVGRDSMSAKGRAETFERARGGMAYGAPSTIAASNRSSVGCLCKQSRKLARAARAHLKVGVAARAA